VVPPAQITPPAGFTLQAASAALAPAAGDDAGEGDKRAWREAGRRQSSRRIVVEHQRRAQAVAPLQRYTGRRATCAETHLAIAALVSDRAARRTTRHRHSTDIVLARQTSC
jgi:hypothetical protein